MSPALTSAIRRDLRTGRRWFADFPGAQGLVWMEFSRNQVALWSPSDLRAPLARVDLDAGRDAIAANVETVEEEGSKVIRAEMELFAAILRALRDVFLPSSRRVRVPCVQPIVTTEGTPDLDAWASALSLADLQAAMIAAIRPLPVAA